MKNGRTLSDEEKALWQQVKATARPLAKHKVIGEKPAKTPPRPISQTRLPPPKKHSAPEKPRAMGSYAGIDANTATRFRKGKYEIDATLDLHGMTRDKAGHALTRFMHAHYAKDSRCLLVITGKGLRGGTGVLREALPSWLSSDALAPMVLAFDVAKPQHGGSGAYYILLKRKR